MAVTFTTEKRRQKYLILTAAVVIGVAAVILWLGYFREERFVAPPITIVPYKEIRIDFEALENPLLKELQPFGKIPPFEDGEGRENPFLPY